jgi:hypothetical protein
MDESNAFRRKTGRLAGIWKLQRVMEIEKSTVCPLESGAGDGNRTHVRSLGSFYTAIVRRPLFVFLLYPETDFPYSGGFVAHRTVHKRVVAQFNDTRSVVRQTPP